MHWCVIFVAVSLLKKYKSFSASMQKLFRDVGEWSFQAIWTLWWIRHEEGIYEKHNDFFWCCSVYFGCIPSCQ